MTNLNKVPRTTLFYTWVIVFCLSMVMIAAGAARGAFGVFFNPMCSELGWSAAQISGTFSFSMIIEGIFSALSGHLSDKYGTKIIIVFAGLVSTTGFILMSFVNSIWQMYLVYGITMGIGLGGLFIPVVSMIAKQFHSKRSLITGIATSANGLGQLAAPIIAYQLIIIYNWRNSYIFQGLAVLALTVIPALFLRRPNIEPEDTSKYNSKNDSKSENTNSFSFTEARKTGLFWIMILMQACYAYCFLSVLVHIAPYSIEIGIPAMVAANILACLGAAMIAGRLGLGALADKIGSKKTMLVGFAALFTSMTLLLLTKEIWSLFLFSIICGIGVGGISASQSPLAAEYFGLKSHGAIFGAMGGVTVILGSLGPFFTGILFDCTGNYNISFITCEILSIAGFIICLTIKKPAKSL